MKSYLHLKAAIAATLVLGGCIATSLPTLRTETAQRIAAPAWMIKRDIPAAPYLLRAYERIHDRGGVANLYIEGDGINGKHSIAENADFTPVNPVGLHLASKDNAKNLIYLARPCQFNGRLELPHTCDNKEWQENRFSKDVIESYNNALNEISARYGIRAYNLIGYSGGAAIATMLAGERKDILSVRTVAGILDNSAYATVADEFPISKTRTAAEHASDVSKTPQYHFIGGQDTIVTPSVLSTYLSDMPPTNCVQTMLVQEAEHEAGWVDKWPELLKLSVNCSYNNASFIEELQRHTPQPEAKPETKIKAFDGKNPPVKP